MKTKSTMTLDRVLSRFGLSSRMVAREAIRTGRLKVNGQVDRNPDRWVNASKDTFHLDGKLLKPARKIYLLFYKPKGVITSHGDPDERKTIYECLGKGVPWVSPVGRLDKDTSGLILLTNDTDFADFVASPESNVSKTYLVKASGLIDDATLKILSARVDLGRREQARPQKVTRLEDRGKYTWLEVVLTEGKNREVRRMLEAVGFAVLKLVRTRIGPLSLQGLEVGEWRRLSDAEVAMLRSSARKIRSRIHRPRSSQSGG